MCCAAVLVALSSAVLVLLNALVALPSVAGAILQFTQIARSTRVAYVAAIVRAAMDVVTVAWVSTVM